MHVEAAGRDVTQEFCLTSTVDPIVLVAKYTRVTLDDQILEMAKSISGDRNANAALVGWQLPKFKWINRVPGCGKTYIVENFDEKLRGRPTTRSPLSKADPRNTKYMTACLMRYWQ